MKLDDANLETLPGVGPKTKSQLQSIGIFRITDLILFLPDFLIDKSKLTDIDQVQNGDKCLFIGTVIKVITSRGSRQTLIVTVSIGNQKTIQIRFLHKIIVYSYIKVGLNIRFSGVMYLRNNLYQIIHPDVEVIKDDEELMTVIPYYRTKRRISQKKLRKLIEYSLNYILKKSNIDIFDSTIQEKLGVPDYLDALRYCHLPSSADYETSNNLFLQGRKRFVLEELFAYKLSLSEAKDKSKQEKSYDINIDYKKKNIFIKKLPFNLTNSQSKALIDIESDFSNSYPSKRLIQGDVGSGKTIIAIIASYYMAISKLQVVLLVPTEILCNQHCKTFNSFLSDFNINIGLFTNKMSKKDRDAMLLEISSGNIDIIIGTHALLYKQLVFSNLGLVIIDEQHKFGVKQRLTLSNISNNNKHLPNELYLSATPIPRSLSLVLYEGLDYTIIDEKPAGRTIITTQLVSTNNRTNLHKHIKNALINKEQIYWVSSCINPTDNEEVEYIDRILCALKDEFADIRISTIHGKADHSDNIRAMQDFASNKSDILLSTTMIEIGVDVPNATCIVIENSERFGLSQLHQLRGRVGRGTKPSSCFLIHKEKLSDLAFSRLNSLEKLSNGFSIAEEDLKNRGSGEYFGDRQSGIDTNFKLAVPVDLVHNLNLIRKTHHLIKNIGKDKIDKLKKRWEKNNRAEIQL